MTPIEDLVRRRIATEGPIRFSTFVDIALYDPDFGFYVAGGQAGRRGDFVTSAEVGPLFGACLAKYLDEVWKSLGEPNPFVVLEAGAGPGTLARSIRAAEPACRDVLRYIAVEVSAAQRAQHPDWIVSLESLADAKSYGPCHLVVANELLDNLPFNVAQQTSHGWMEVRVDIAEANDELVEVLRPLEMAVEYLPDDASVGVKIPLADAAVAWCDSASDLIDAGRLVVIDYLSPVAEMATGGDWIRTYRANERGGPALDAPGTQDVTAHLPLEGVLAHGAEPMIQTQADFLRACGLDALVEDGRRVWAERAHIGDLQALKARSRITEAEALTDRSGLGGFRVISWVYQN